MPRQTKYEKSLLEKVQIEGKKMILNDFKSKMFPLKSN